LQKLINPIGRYQQQQNQSNTKQHQQQRTMTVVNNANNRRPRGPYAFLYLVGLSAVFTYYLDSYLNEVTLDEESPAVDMGGFTATEQQLARARQLGISKRVSICVYDTNNHHYMHNDLR